MPQLVYPWGTEDGELAKAAAETTTSNTQGLVAVGVDAGGIARFLRVDNQGRVVLAGGGGGAWPGTTPTPLDANDIYAYNCLETSGTTLVNAGSGPNGDLTLVGNAYLNSKYPAKSQGAVRFFATNPGDGAVSGTSCNLTTATNGYTIEAYVSSTLNNQFSNVLVIDDGPLNQSALALTHYYTGGGFQSFWTVGVRVGGIITDTSFNTDNKVQNRMVTHLMATYEFGVGMRLYVNGVLGATNFGTVGPMNPMVRVTVGTDAAFGGASFNGYMTQVRCSNVVRNAAYALARAENCFGL